MPRYIDADKFINELKTKGWLKDKFLDNSAEMIAVEAIIDNQPTADVVEVVRCKDCKYLMFSDCYGECSKGYKGIVSPNDFCSHGQKKEEN